MNVHLNGLANVRLKYSMNAKIFSRRSDSEVKSPRLIARRTRMLNQIEIQFSHDVCLGTYTKRIR